MKKLFLVCVAYLITVNVYAQSDSLNYRMNTNDKNSNPNYNLDNRINQDNNNSKMENTSNPRIKNPNADINNNSNRQDSMHTIKPIQPVRTSTPERFAPVLKPANRETVPVEKSNVKTPKDKNMYLVPDSARKKIEND